MAALEIRLQAAVHWDAVTLMRVQGLGSGVWGFGGLGGLGVYGFGVLGFRSFGFWGLGFRLYWVVHAIATMQSRKQHSP